MDPTSKKTPAKLKPAAVEPKTKKPAESKPVKKTTPAEEPKPVKSKPAKTTPAKEATPAKTLSTEEPKPVKPKPAKTTSKEDPKPVKRVSFSEEDDGCIDWENLSAEGSDEAETEESADNGSDDECVISGEDDDVFDLAAFKQQNGAFNQEEAEKAFRKWKQNRQSAKKPPAWFTAHDPPPIDEKDFLAKRRDVTLRLIESYKEKLNEVNQDLQIPDLKPAMRKKLLSEKSQYESYIAAREQELK